MGWPRRRPEHPRQPAPPSATKRSSGKWPTHRFLSVLDAERSVYAAEDELVSSEKTTAITLIAVYKTLGGGWSPEARA